MKVFLRFASFASFLVLPLLASAGGDVTGDGQVDVSDVNVVIDAVLGKGPTDNCDINGDGIVDVSDVNLVIDEVLGKNKPDEPGLTTEDETFVVNGVEFKVIYVEGGSFEMGNANNPKESPVHKVTLSPFKMMETEVIQKLFYSVIPIEECFPQQGDYYYDYISKYRNDEWPLFACTWEKAMEFAEKISEITGRTFRLPTEAEWEYAARGGQKSEGYIYSGSNDIYAVGNVHGPTTGYEQALKVPKTLQPNELGLYDMTGNVCEFCFDSELRYYTADEQVNPICAGGSFLNYDLGDDAETYRIARGGYKDLFPFMHSGATNTARIYIRYYSLQPGYGIRLVLVK